MTAEPRWKTTADLKAKLHRQAVALKKARELAEAIYKWADNLECVGGGPTVIELASELSALLPPEPKTKRPKTEGLVKEGSDAPTP